MPSNTSQLIYVLFLVALGFLVGAALATWLGKRERENKPTPPTPVVKETRVFYGLSGENFEEVVSLWRSKTEGQLVVLQEGKPVEAYTALPEGRRKQMEVAARAWLVWMGLLPLKAKPNAIPSVLEAQRMASNAVTAPAAPAAPVSTPPAPPVSAAQPAAPAPTPAAEIKKAGSIVQQINEILQENLRASGLINRGVSLAEDPREGVIVYIGMQRFMGIDSVTDPEIRLMIKSAAAEWERRAAQIK